MENGNSLPYVYQSANGPIMSQMNPNPRNLFPQELV